MSINIKGKNGGSLNYKPFKKLETKNGIVEDKSYIVLEDQGDFLNRLQKSEPSNIKVYLIANMIWIDFKNIDFYYSCENLDPLIIRKIEDEYTITFCFIDKNKIDLQYEITYNNIILL